MLRIMLTQTYFEKAIAKAIDEARDSLVKSPLGDSHRHAYIKGQCDGLGRSLELYRAASRADIEAA